MKLLILTPIIFPILSGIYIRFSDEKKINRTLISSAFINLFLTLICVFLIHDEKLTILKFNEIINLYFLPDVLGKIFAVLVSTLWIFTTFYSIDYMSHEKNLRSYSMFFMMTQGITLSIAFSGNLITLYLFYELLTLVTFPLVIQTGTDKALQIGKKYLIYSFVGATFVLFGLILLYSQLGTLDFKPGGIVGNLENIDNNYYLMVYLLLFLGLGVKAALVPFHSWLPAAMVAPTPVSALLHAVAVVKSGIFSLMRMTYYVLGWELIEKIGGNKYTLILVLVSILMGSFLAMSRKNLKKRLAYSTISQLGYIMLGLVVFDKSSFTGGILHMIFHATTKITLFFCVGAIMHYEHKTELDEIEGIGKRMPITMTCFTISSICLIGIPPMNGFVSKWYLAIGGLETGNFVVPIMLLLSALLTAGYLIPIVSTAFFRGAPSTEVEIKEPGNFMLVPIVILTAINVIVGIMPNLLINIIDQASKLLF
jgi:multicomponent Na+:H+ antiporter subunit D